MADGPESPRLEGLKAAADLAKQIVSLSTGFVALTVTFLKDVIPPDTTGARHVSLPLTVSWTCFVLAILAALMTLMAVTGSMAALERRCSGEAGEDDRRLDAFGPNVRRPAFAMVLFFVVAIITAIAAAACARWA
jgi:hypothetical protein